MKKVLFILVQVVLTVALVYGVSVLTWKWVICRTYCPLGHSLQVTSKTGGIADKDGYSQKGQKGVYEQTPGPGRHFYNPYYFSVEQVPDMEIKPGRIGIVRNNVGQDLPNGRYLAKPDEKGTQRQFLTPGTWRINPFGQRVEESTLCIYRDKVYLLAADGYLHAVD